MTPPVALTGAGNVTTVSATSAATLTGGKPSGVADGDLLWALYAHRNAAAVITPPSGWAQQLLQSTNGTVGLWTKPIPSASAETATTYAFSNTGGSGRVMLAIGRITGARLSAPVDVAGALSVITGSSSTIDPSVTPSNANGLLLAINVNNNTSGTPSAYTAPTGMTEVAQMSVGNSGTPTASSDLQVAQQALTGTSATGTRTAPISLAAGNSAGWLIVIAGPAQGSAALSATATLTASAILGAAAAASISAAASLTASAVQAQFASAALTATATLSASPAAKSLNVLLGDGTWAPVIPEILTGSGWQV